MSAVCDTVLPGSARLHIGTGAARKHGGPTLRKSRSHAGLLAPLVQLVRDPFGTLGGALGSLGELPEQAVAPESANRQTILYLRMRNAETYEEWKAAAIEADTLEGNDKWKLEEESQEYDAGLVAARLQQLDDARLNCDVKKMLYLVRTALTRGLGGMGDTRLYKHSHIGTKALIERYIESAQKTLIALLDVSAKQGDECPLSSRVISDELVCARQSFGRTALLLSGGGTFGMNHIGVVKSLWEARLLPRIISGASAGSIVCAVLSTKTDAEIPRTLDEFCYGDLGVFEKEGEKETWSKMAARFLKSGNLYDISNLMNVMRNLLGDITFQESYNRTQRILNITVSTAALYELPRLLNYITAPNVMIWSAVCASCSVPLVFSAASLLEKDPRTGEVGPWNSTPDASWIDGSVDNDLPMNRLAEMFNVNHFIVSQVNAHVVPFLAKEESLMAAEAQQSSALSASSSWIHDVANLAKSEALHRLHVLSDHIGIFPNALTKLRSVLNQRYSGDITILPPIPYSQIAKVLANPTTDFMLQCMLNGERATWPKLSRVQNHVAIELALDQTIQQFRTRVAFSPSQVNLRLNHLHRPLSQGDDRQGVQLDQTPVKKTRFDAHSLRSFSSAEQPYLPTVLGRHKDFREGLPRPLLGDASLSLDETSSSDEDKVLLDENTMSDILSAPSPHQLPSEQRSIHFLFPSASQPNTPISAPSTLFSHRDHPPLKPNLTMTSGGSSKAAPSNSPVQRYKRLFHQPPHSSSDAPFVFPNVQQETGPEHRNTPPTETGKSNPPPVAQVRVPHTPPVSPPSSPSPSSSRPI